jgi:hypothetical protein
MLISRINRRISTGSVGRPQRRPDFQRQYDRKPARCYLITVSGLTIASASHILGNNRQTPTNISLSTVSNESLLELTRRSTLICCLSTKISASSIARDRSKSIAVPKISLHRTNMEQQHRPILDQPPVDWIYDRHRRPPHHKSVVRPTEIDDRLAPSARNLLCNTKMPGWACVDENTLSRRPSLYTL